MNIGRVRNTRLIDILKYNHNITFKSFRSKAGIHQKIKTNKL